MRGCAIVLTAVIVALLVAVVILLGMVSDALAATPRSARSWSAPAACTPWNAGHWCQPQRRVAP